LFQFLLLAQTGQAQRPTSWAAIVVAIVIFVIAWMVIYGPSPEGNQEREARFEIFRWITFTIRNGRPQRTRPTDGRNGQ
jgi:hypothetical protein